MARNGPPRSRTCQTHGSFQAVTVSPSRVVLVPCLIKSTRTAFRAGWSRWARRTRGRGHGQEGRNSAVIEKLALVSNKTSGSMTMNLA